MKQFIGYTFRNAELARLNSMDFSYTRAINEPANNGLGQWIYFYRGKQLEITREQARETLYS